MGMFAFRKIRVINFYIRSYVFYVRAINISVGVIFLTKYIHICLLNCYHNHVCICNYYIGVLFVKLKRVFNRAKFCEMLILESYTQMVCNCNDNMILWQNSWLK